MGPTLGRVRNVTTGVRWLEPGWLGGRAGKAADRASMHTLFLLMGQVGCRVYMELIVGTKHGVDCESSLFRAVRQHLEPSE